MWEMLSIPVPSRHEWKPGAPPPNPGYDAPVLAHGRIAFDRAQAPADAVELPDGVGFTILRFSGSLDEWLAMVHKEAPAQNPIDPNTIRRTTLAGRPAVAYSYVVTGISINETSILKLGDDRVLLVEKSNVDNPEYQIVLRMLMIGNQ